MIWGDHNELHVGIVSTVGMRLSWLPVQADRETGRQTEDTTNLPTSLALKMLNILKNIL